MVLDMEYKCLKKKNWFLKYFYFLRNKKQWTGGWSYGKKVFWGQVGKISGRWFCLRVLWNYTIINISGIVQNFFKVFRDNYIIAFIFFWKYGLLSCIPAAETIKISDDIKTIVSDENIKVGSSTILKNFSIGVLIFSVQLKYNTQGKISWSSGTTCKILKKISNCVFVQFPSKTIGIIPEICFATKGMSKRITVAKLQKAGQAWRLGKIPKVWGIAMNPVDHPHGGWTNGGIHPRTPTGFLTKNIKTWKKKKWSNPLIFSLWY